ncbi:MAG: hypothetical protein IKI71_01000 [Lachnospiraceae bacterium]|nr:hypothetical protein [Lachnospiraceae bacterium]
MENYNAKFINQWNKFENAIGVTKVKSSYECTEQDERPKDKIIFKRIDKWIWKAKQR